MRTAPCASSDRRVTFTVSRAGVRFGLSRNRDSVGAERRHEVWLDRDDAAQPCPAVGVAGTSPATTDGWIEASIRTLR
jgi:hypothetical protein